MATPKGYTRTRWGFRAWVRVSPFPLATKSFPRHATETQIKNWRADERARLRLKKGLQEVARPPVGTFADDVKVYLAAVAGMPTYSHRQREMAAWVRAFGTRPRAEIASLEIQTLLHAWRMVQGPNVGRRRTPAGGRAPQTFSAQSCNLYRAALSHLWTVLDGKSAANPVKDVPKFRTPDPEPRALSLEDTRAIVGQLRPSKTKARLLLIATTGIRHAQLMRLQPARDWQPDAAILYVRSGKRSKPRAVPLSTDATAALKMLVRYAGEGKFSQPSLTRAFRRAIAAVNVARRKTNPHAVLIPETTRVYDLRHTFGTEVMRQTGNIHAVQQLLTHTSPKLTERYLLAAVPDQLRSAVRKLPRILQRSKSRLKSA